MKRIAFIVGSILIIAALAFAGPDIRQQNSYDPASVAITGGTIDGATIGGTTAGKVQSRFEEIVSATSVTVTLQQATMTVLNNYGQANDVIYSLPTAAEGYGFTFVAGTGVAKYVRIDPVAGDTIYLDGSSICGDGKYITLSSTTVGQCVSCVTFQTGASAYDWLCLSGYGTWVCE